MNLTLVVAMARNRAIGQGNKMPWHLPEDLKHFKALTSGHCLIMGRKTFDSIGKALPNRRTIVITRQSDWSQAGCERADSVETAIQLAKQDNSRKVFVVGGSQIYAQSLALADTVIATHIDIDVEADTFFPQLPPDQWRLTKEQKEIAATGTHYRICEYQRIAAT
jgi:dihydrofolate reductase